MNELSANLEGFSKQALHPDVPDPVLASLPAPEPALLLMITLLLRRVNELCADPIGCGNPEAALKARLPVTALLLCYVDELLLCRVNELFANLEGFGKPAAAPEAPSSNPSYACPTGAHLRQPGGLGAAAVVQVRPLAML